jgi:hypothetical protein
VSEILKKLGIFPKCAMCVVVQVQWLAKPNNVFGWDLKAMAGKVKPAGNL